MIAGVDTVDDFKNSPRVGLDTESLNGAGEAEIKSSMQIKEGFATKIRRCRFMPHLLSTLVLPLAKKP